jgi:hypothetical protein
MIRKPTKVTSSTKPTFRYKKGATFKGHTHYKGVIFTITNAAPGAKTKTGPRFYEGFWLDTRVSKNGKGMRKTVNKNVLDDFFVALT